MIYYEYFKKSLTYTQKITGVYSREANFAKLIFNSLPIANIISYLHNAFVSNGKNIDMERIKELREYKPKDGSFFTEEELLDLKNLSSTERIHLQKQ